MDNLYDGNASKFTEDFEVLFYSCFKQIQQYGCTYMYYTLIGPDDTRLRFCTDEDWINTYLNEGLLNNDPLKAISQEKISRILLWNHVPINGREAKKVMEARKSFKKFNGINIIEYDSQSMNQRILTLCTDCESYNLPKELLEKSEILKDLSSKIFRFA